MGGEEQDFTQFAFLILCHDSTGCDDFVCLFDLILYVHSTIFQLCGTVLPGFNQY